jgi:bifunctional DNA-binding transcriptional regulator/antitoxin component of YhaV-PrlF toxin-antitoxin module
VVIPAEARKRLGLKPGDKLLVFRHPHGPGLMLARLDDMRAFMDELQQWDVMMATLVEDTEEESEGE